MKKATTYKEWSAAAQALDEATGKQAWKLIAPSDMYDYKLIASRLATLKICRETGEGSSMVYALRSGLLRNLGGITDKRLYSFANIGTKKLIEDYFEEVILQLDVLGENDFKDVTSQQKMEAFNDIRQCFGNTCLLLYGGATFGLYHLGVIKALHDQKLIPKIICGSSVGALIAALVCIKKDDELREIFEENGIDLKAFSTKNKKGNISRKISRFLKHGYLLDLNVLEDCVKSNLGDITFEEAYLRTKRVLNITVSSTRKNEVPRVLNYLTAPNVLIRSAATVSLAMVGVFGTGDLLEKDKSGHLSVWNPTSIKWSEQVAYFETESPETRVAELFNVNHFILSEATPRIGKLEADQSISGKIMTFLASELQFRVHQMGKWGLFPPWLVNLFDRRIRVHIAIAPVLETADFYTIFSNPTYASLSYWIKKGEQSTWPVIELIKKSTIIELKLNEVGSRLRTWSESKEDPARTKSADKRYKSIA